MPDDALAGWNVAPVCRRKGDETSVSWSPPPSLNVVSVQRGEQAWTVTVDSRDRAGLYAGAARQGAPQARQVADRFHLLQNFRETVERQLGRFEAPISDSRVNARDDQATPPLPARSDCASDAETQKRLMCRGRQAVRQELFDEIRALFE